MLCAALLAACVFLFVYLGTFWGVVSLVAALALFLLTLLFKGLQEDREKKDAPPARGDFFAPQPTAAEDKADEANAASDTDGAANGAAEVDGSDKQ